MQASKKMVNRCGHQHHAAAGGPACVSEQSAWHMIPVKSTWYIIPVQSMIHDTCAEHDDTCAELMVHNTCAEHMVHNTCAEHIVHNTDAEHGT